MNINPKKSWHVRSKQNLARVRRDEAKAAEEEKEKQRRIDLAESEARSELLRSLALKKFVSEESKGAQIEEKKLSHVNFFEEMEAGEKGVRHNKEHQEEERKKKEKAEMDVGLLTYLGQGSAEFEAKKPWYLDSTKNPLEGEVEEKSKQSLDPMHTIKHYLHLNQKYESHKKGDEVKHKADKKSHRRHKKDKKAHKKSVAEMREERLARERKERLRAEKLMRGEVAEKKDEVVTDLRKMSYNSRFNPDLPRYK